MLLALDTSTQWASLSLLDEQDAVIYSRAWEIGQQHSVQMFTAITDMLSETGATIADITAIGVAQGPGSFNGVRVGVTIAKVMGTVQQIPVIGIPTLTAIGRVATAQVPANTQILTLLEAGRDEVYALWYDREPADPAAFKQENAITLTSIADLIGSMQPEVKVAVCGEISLQHSEQLQAMLGEQIQILEPDAVRTRAQGVALLAAQAFANNAPNEYLALEPLYIRHPNISISKRHPLPPLGEEGKL